MYLFFFPQFRFFFLLKEKQVDLVGSMRIQNNRGDCLSRAMFRAIGNVTSPMSLKLPLGSHVYFESFAFQASFAHRFSQADSILTKVPSAMIVPWPKGGSKSSRYLGIFLKYLSCTKSNQTIVRYRAKGNIVKLVQTPRSAFKIFLRITRACHASRVL